jgi:hypothetical protein
MFLVADCDAGLRQTLFSLCSSFRAAILLGFDRFTSFPLRRASLEAVPAEVPNRTVTCFAMLCPCWKVRSLLEPACPHRSGA